MIGFPDLDAARAWYESPAHQDIAPLRACNSDGEVVLLDGTPDGHRGPDILD